MTGASSPLALDDFITSTSRHWIADQGEIQGADSDATMVKPPKPPGNQPEVSEPPGLSGAEIARERDVLIAALEPSETVADGLRRLRDSDR